MTYGAFTSHEVAAFDVRTPAKPIPQTILCAAALTLSSAVGLLLLYGRPVAPPAFEAAVVVPVQMAERAAQAPAAIPPLRRYGALLDPTLIKRQAPGAFAQSAPLRTSFAPLRHPAGVPTVTAQIVAGPLASPVAALPTRVPAQTAPAAPAPQQVTKADVAEVDIDTDTGAPEIPLPMPRPTSLTTLEHAPTRAPAAAAAVRMAEAEMPAAPAPAAVAPAAPAPEAAQPGFFEKFFGGVSRPGNALGYANSEDGFFGRGSTAPDRYTAVYDITRHTVTLPDGTRLEAHSGLGDLVDNPAGVTVRMRGATPPNMYELKEREAMFHGVRALRMTPTGGTTYGRGGLLTHSYMLRGRLGESNGCVVFANYPAFLRAYDTGMVRRLLVVARAS